MSKLKLIKADESLRPLIEYLAIGEDPKLEAQLIAKSKQPNILKFTPKDSKQRFGNPDMLKHWISKGRTIHWLLGPNKDLAGIIWYGKSKFPLDIELDEIPEETFAIRIYDGYAGHGLARPFMTFSLKVAVEEKRAAQEPIAGIWLQTDIDNPAAVAAYTKFGYKEVFRDHKRATMVLSSQEILNVCSK